MNEEYKIRFAVDLEDAEKKYQAFKNKAEKESINITPEVGRTDAEFKSLFGNIQRLSRQASKNLIWSREKRSQMTGFFSSVESKAYSSLKLIEEQYAKLGTEIQTIQTSEVRMKADLVNQDALVDHLGKQLETALSNASISTGTKDELAELFKQLVEAKSIIPSLQKQMISASSAGKSTLARELNAELEGAKRIVAELEMQTNNFRIGDATSAKVPEDVKALQLQYVEATKKAEQMNKAIEKLNTNNAVEKKTQEAVKLGEEYAKVRDDLQYNPLTTETDSETFAKHAREVENLNNGLTRTGQIMRANTKIGEFWNRITRRMTFTLISWLNPLNVAKKLWSGFKEQNEDVKNTFEIIGKNFIRIFEPALRGIANWLVKIAGYADVFLQGIQKAFGIAKPVSLFDKTVLDTEKTKENIKEINDMTAGFDELHVFNDTDADAQDVKVNADVKFPTLEMPELDTKWTKTLMDWGEKFGKALKWVGDNWKWLVGLWATFKIGAGLLSLWNFFSGLGNLFGPGSLIGKGISWLSNTLGITGGTLAKFLTGLGMVGGGTYTAITQAINLGKNWQDLDTKQKILGIGATGLSSAIAGVGMVMLGFSGPVGWATAAVVALTSLGFALAQTQDGIESVAKEQKKLADAQEWATKVNDAYKQSLLLSADAMDRLEQLEKETGLSGADLAMQVENGILSVDKMTSAQKRVYQAYLDNKDLMEENIALSKEKTKADKEVTIQTLETEIANARATNSYGELKKSIMDAYNSGAITAQEASKLMNQSMATLSEEAQQVFMQDVPEAIAKGLDPTAHYSVFRRFGDWVTNFFSGLINSIGGFFVSLWNWLTGKGWTTGETQVPNTTGGATVPSYAVGTNYVPNDQLALVHRGEAIVPARYNNAATFGGGQATSAVLQAATAAITSLNVRLAAGIPVFGEFTQRGNDLVATVRRIEAGNGAQPISNPAFAR